ncbi:FAD-dependent monooxygenase [Methylotenera sp.]|uniref:FAD-dependent monooxygenase n=1 Tax=Methylotenera sp. TaxID=2051956 RepID=UPI002732DE17|nr:FAD-dependent monooxygenase [Methylotenera sp.]MDP3778336.1 FAD-dependent monooxygenase [Methylotenera sp.]
MISTSENIVIVGGGPVGMVLSLLLAKNNIASTVLEVRKQGAANQDTRALALSYGTRRILEKLGIWQSLSAYAAAINTIHVSQKGSLGRSVLQASDYQQEALGYVLSYGALCTVLNTELQRFSMVKFIDEAQAEAITYDANQATIRYSRQGEVFQLTSQLAVLADGGRSLEEAAGLKRETKEYGHDALITKVSAELPHHNVAYERFTTDGPMALLPNGERDFSLVWTGKKALISPLLDLSDAEFLTQFHAQFGDRVGRFLTVEKRMTFPLKLSQLQEMDTPHLVVIGNAAQTMHPVAGQGFNVGLRDAEVLAQQIMNTAAGDIGTKEMLTAYRANRRTDTKNGLLFTDFLVNIFSNDILGFAKLRSTGLGLFDIVKPVKRHLVRKMSFGK